MRYAKKQVIAALTAGAPYHSILYQGHTYIQLRDLVTASNRGSLRLPMARDRRISLYK